LALELAAGSGVGVGAGAGVGVVPKPVAPAEGQAWTVPRVSEVTRYSRHFVVLGVHQAGLKRPIATRPEGDDQTLLGNTARFLLRLVVEESDKGIVGGKVARGLAGFIDRADKPGIYGAAGRAITAPDDTVTRGRPTSVS